jgi:hypothetical protein
LEGARGVTAIKGFQGSSAWRIPYDVIRDYPAEISFWTGYIKAEIAEFAAATQTGGYENRFGSQIASIDCAVDGGHIMQVHSFVVAEEVEELVFLRDQNKALVRHVGELKAENRQLRKELAGK